MEKLGYSLSKPAVYVRQLVWPRNSIFRL